MHLSGAGEGNLAGSAQSVGSCNAYINCYHTELLVEGASPTISNSTIDQSAGSGMEVFSGGAPTLSSSTVSNNAGYGVQVDDLASVPTLTSDVFTNNSIQVSPDAAAHLSGISFVGSGLTIAVLGGATAANDTWTGHGVPYLLESDLRVPVTYTLALSGPLTLRFSGNLYVAGAFNATGTASSPISLTSSITATPAPGDWGGIAYQPGSSGTLTYVHLSYAGRGTLASSTGNVGSCNTYHNCYFAGVLAEGASPTISNSTVDQVVGNGVEAFGGANPTLTNDSFSANSGWAVLYDGGNLPNTFTQDSGLTAQGNGHNAIGFPGGAVNGTWNTATLGIPLILNADVTVSSLNLAAGSSLAMVGNLYVTGGLTATGTAAAPITLTSASTSPRAGRLGRHRLQPGSTGALSYVHLSYAGKGNLASTTQNVGTCNTYINCYRTGLLVEGASPTISNSTIDQNAGNGMEVFSGGLPTLSSDTLTTDAGWAVLYDAVPQDLSMVTHLSGSGDGYTAIGLAGGTITNPLWSAATLGLPLRTTADISVASGAAMRLGAGTTVLFGANLYVAGGLSATGTAAAPITLTSASATPAPGDWGGIAYQPGSTRRPLLCAPVLRGQGHPGQ